MQRTSVHERIIPAASDGAVRMGRRPHRAAMRSLIFGAVILPLAGCTDSLSPSSHESIDAASVEVLPKELSLGTGHSERLTAVVLSDNGEPTTAPVAWSSSDSLTAAVAPDGTVQGLQKGTTTIRATVGSRRGEAEVEIRSPISNVAMAAPTETLGVGATVRLELTLVTADGDTISSSHVRVRWASSDTSVAQVDDDGWLTARKPGTVRITAESEGAEGYHDVEVSTSGKWKVTVQPGSAVLYALGDTVRLTAQLTDPAGSPAENPDFTWSSLDESVATVNGSGRVLALAAGTAVIVAAVNGSADSASVEVRQESPPPPGVLPAFPGAEGWGATALERCRELPLVVHKVTNTKNSGTGSLRDVLENRVRRDRYDVVVFRTGGLIRLSSDIRESARHCLYIAGQTAPGGGISIVGRQVEFRNSDDVVIRHLRHRGQSRHGLMHRGGFRIVYDHITSSWAGAYSSGFNILLLGQERRPLGDVTIQNSLIYEPDGFHPTVLGLAGHPKDEPFAERISAHRNVLMGPGHRLPMCSAREVSFTNNVVYNWVGRASESNNASSCDFVANYHKRGPATEASSQRFSRRPFVFGDSCEDGPGDNCTYSHYVAENKNLENNYQAGGNPWDDPNREVTCRVSGGGAGLFCQKDDDPVPSEIRRFTPLPLSPIPAYPQAMTTAFVDHILLKAGHSRRLGCDGSWIGVRDNADNDRIAWFYGNVGPRSHVRTDTLSVPTPLTGSPCQDTDGDGIPDDYEMRYTGSATGLRADQVTQSGYLAVELYLAGKSLNWRP